MAVDCIPGSVTIVFDDIMFTKTTVHFHKRVIVKKEKGMDYSVSSSPTGSEPVNTEA